ncbi:MAG: DUF3558 domain-containing protein [Nocardia sp.]|nr:DUF3558 domain-containing protein [Nocardia sp.]
MLVAGCGSGSQSTSGAAPSSTIAAEVPSGFDPCNDIPQGVLDSLQLESKIPAKASADGGVEWKGCRWVKSNYYAISIRTTNLTIDMVRDKHFQDTQEYTLAGRRAISTRQVPEHPNNNCSVDVDMKGGSLEFFLSNSPSDQSADMNTCDMAREVAEKVVQILPAGV